MVGGQPIVTDEKEPQDGTAKSGGADPSEDADSETKNERKQNGVRKIEAITSTWSYTALVSVFVMIWITEFTHSFQQQIVGNLAPYVTSSFSRHGLTATVGIVASLAGGTSQLVFAKICDVWGRLECYILTHFLCMLGLILMAVANNIETYAAATVFWEVGSGGIGYVQTVLISDLTSLRNRMVIYTMNATSAIGPVFAGPVVAQLFLQHSNLKWAFGAFAIIMPSVGSGIMISLLYNLRQAKKLGKLELNESGRTWYSSAVFYAKEVDIIGMFLLVAGFAIFLLPFSLVSYSAHGWKTGYVIAMIVLGVFILVAFGFWEYFFAPIPMIPWANLKDRTTFGAGLLACTLFISFGAWGSYFSSYLQVVHQQTVAHAGTIIGIYTIASCTWGPFVGLLIRYTKHYKWIAILFIPVALLATALLILFRSPGTKIGYIIMAQIFKATSGGTLIICEQLAVMAIVAHNEVAIMLAAIGLFASIGSSIGRAISGAIWTNELPEYLLAALPEDQKANATAIYGDLTIQLSFPFNSPTRDAIVYAYGEVQRKMLIAGACFMPLALVGVLMWRNINVGKKKQTAGNVW
ncbi:siderophore iron transporter mirB [Pseudomassariella vexata]|uniref:Siderophore iron transporter mirB n=1 Tax=Pseudomassariella vexata TaxID=1141098 RepID=A0A1Y2DIZ2_9PEZI|nr:siderophore iron transporter mirB [Pseudomassariella vexata]ORY59146.1 siderophore iron transporter mirB [Pseudomassariella vexata]